MSTLLCPTAAPGSRQAWRRVGTAQPVKGPACHTGAVSSCCHLPPSLCPVPRSDGSISETRSHRSALIAHLEKESLRASAPISTVLFPPLLLQALSCGLGRPCLARGPHNPRPHPGTGPPVHLVTILRVHSSSPGGVLGPPPCSPSPRSIGHGFLE